MTYKLGEKYSWLRTERVPKILLEALKEFGTMEVPGIADNPKILGWAEEIGSKAGMDYAHDSIPWCGLFMAVCAKRAGYEPPKIAVRASSWDKFGNEVSGDKAPGPISLGDILRFQRQGGGHVGLYVGEDEAAFHVLGGNQSDAVTITRISKGRLVEARRCPWRIGQPKNVRPIHLSATGALSQNEA